jgi:ribosomal protein S6
MDETSKETVLRNYEIIFILAPQLEGVDLDKTKQEITGLITKHGGTINFKESEKRTLAYPINKQIFGIYLTTQTSISPENFSEISKQFRLNKQILRHIITQLETAKAAPEKLRPVRKTAPKKILTPEFKKPASPETTEGKLEEIDKKLDELIDKI